ncbi:MAG TPA: hypothetical protein VF806_00995, partial [Anaerolineaceae bacterium]
PQVWLGGLAWTGAVAGAWLAVITITLVYRFRRDKQLKPMQAPLGLVADRLYPLLPPIAITTWLGCWQVGAAYGIPAPAGAWWGIKTLDENVVSSLRFPLQPVAAAVLIIFFLILDTRGKKNWPAGRLATMAAAGLLIHLLAAAFLSGAPTPSWYGLRLDFWFAAAFLALLGLLVIFNSFLPRLWRKIFARKQSYSSL